MNGRVAMPRILVVDDEPAIVLEYRRALEQRTDPGAALAELRDELFATEHDATTAEPSLAFAVESCNQGGAAVEAVRVAVDTGSPFSVVFLDMNMPPGINGIEAARQIRAADPLVNIVLVTGTGLLRPDQLMHDVPPADRLFVFKKPFHAIELRQVAVALCGKWNAHRELRLANETLEARVQQRTAELYRLAYFDPATGLPNRRKILKELAKRMIDAREHGHGIAVIALDLERFNFINETMGYQFGNCMLVEVAKRLQAMAGADDVVGRFGADSFGCLLVDHDTSRLGERVAQIRSIFQRPFTFDERELFARCSVGVATFPEHGGTSDEVFRRAEAALHRSRRDPARRTVYYEPSMGAGALRRLALESDLRGALTDRRIQPYFQPQIDLRTGDLWGFEVLARWIQPDGTAVSPVHFVPVIEEAGLATELFESMLRQAAAALAQWDREGIFGGDLSINMSAQQVGDERVPAILREVVDEFGLQPSRLSLELTETVLLTDFETSRCWLTQLRELGVEILIDDFGTGYSSLQYLADLPFDGLKIDRSFIDGLADSESKQRIVGAVVALGHTLGVAVTAEGIEDDEQRQLVVAAGCEYGQGYWFGRPASQQATRDGLSLAASAAAPAPVDA